MAARKAAPRSVHVLRVDIDGIAPPVWRRLEVPSDTTLARLHGAIQAAFPWTNSHLHLFKVKGSLISDPRFELDHADGDEGKFFLADVAPRVGAKFGYEYDFGDSWDHAVEVVEIRAMEAGAGAPKMRCTGGARACPPDDCGGVPGYDDLLDALRSPNHKRHEELTEWLAEIREELAEEDPRFAGPFDPEAFDLEAADAAVARQSKRSRS